MLRLTLAAAAALAFSTAAYADHHKMMIGDYPKTAAEVEYCWKARMDKDIEIPYGCRTLGERILIGVSHEMKK